MLSVYSIPSIMLEHMSMLIILVLTAIPKNMPCFPHFINKIGSVEGSDLPQSQGNIWQSQKSNLGDFSTELFSPTMTCCSQY